MHYFALLTDKHVYVLVHVAFPLLYLHIAEGLL